MQAMSYAKLAGLHPMYGLCEYLKIPIARALESLVCVLRDLLMSQV